MKKIFILATSLFLTVFMAIPACAVTPALKVPDMPEISNIKIDITVGSDEDDDVKLSNLFWKKYFEKHPIVFHNNMENKEKNK